MPGVRRHPQIDLEEMSYLLVDGAFVIAGGAFVVFDCELSGLLHPVNNAPITSPNSTIRVDSLFIVRVNVYQKPEKDK